MSGEENNSFLRDVNRLPFSTIDSFGVIESRPDAFAGGTGGARGDKDGAKAAFTLFTVTGEVLVRIFGVCTVDLVGNSATVSVGVTGNVAALIALATATDIEENDVYAIANPAVGTDLLSDVTGPHVIVNGLDIIETVATQDVTAGQIRYVCLWRPLSRNGSVVSAV